MSTREESVRLHHCGFNCAQSVLCALGSYTGLDEKTALAVSGGFGGGLRCGEVCGALSGAVMALGMCHRFDASEKTAEKLEIAAAAKEMTEKFRERFGRLRCCELKENGIRCDALIEEAAAMAEEMMNKGE